MFKKLPLCCLEHRNTLLLFYKKTGFFNNIGEEDKKSKGSCSCSIRSCYSWLYLLYLVPSTTFVVYFIKSRFTQWSFFSNAGQWLILSELIKEVTYEYYVIWYILPNPVSQHFMDFPTSGLNKLTSLCLRATNLLSKFFSNSFPKWVCNFELHNILSTKSHNWAMFYIKKQINVFIFYLLLGNFRSTRLCQNKKKLQ